jgi:hypothetical protein
VYLARLAMFKRLQLLFSSVFWSADCSAVLLMISLSQGTATAGSMMLCTCLYDLQYILIAIINGNLGKCIDVMFRVNVKVTNGITPCCCAAVLIMH